MPRSGIKAEEQCSLKKIIVLNLTKASLCFVFGGKCEISPCDIVSPCVTSASPRHSESRVCGEITQKCDEKRKRLRFPTPHLCMDFTHWQPKLKAGVANSGTHGG